MPRRNEMKAGTMLPPSSLCYAVPSMKRLHFYEARLTAYEAQLTLHEAALRTMKQSPDRLHFYEARLTAYEAFCGIAAKYEAPLARYEANPFQASFL